MSEPHADHDDLVALGLQYVEPDERALLSEHLATCAHCRADYAELEEGIQHTLVAAPSIAPPAGFSGRVLAAMGMSVPEPVSAARAGAPAARRWWTQLTAAAAALVLGLAVGVGGVLAVGDRPPAPSGSSVGGATSASALVNRAGETVGSAGTTVLSGRSYLVITVTRARPGAAYECIVVGDDGQRRSAGTWTLDARNGASEASGSWVVELPEGGLTRVELVVESGAVWSQAEF